MDKLIVHVTIYTKKEEFYIISFIPKGISQILQET